MTPSEPTQRSFMQRGKGGYVNPYVVGVGLGLTLLLAFYVVGRGLGASGAMFRAVAWTADEVAAARDRRTLFRSTHSRSKSFWKKASREPVEMSVPVAIATGACLSSRSAKVAFSNRISS